MFDIEKPKNEEIRAELSMWRGLAILLGIVVVGLIVIFFVIPHLFPPAVEIVKYCGDYPCKEAAEIQIPEITPDGFISGLLKAFECLKPLLAIGFGGGFLMALAGAILRTMSTLGGGK